MTRLLKFSVCVMAALTLLAGGCAKWKPSNASGGARQPKRGFEKPAGTFKIKEVPEKLEAFATDEEAPAGGQAAPEQTEEAQPAAAEEEPTDSRSEPAPDLAPHLKDGGQAQLITDRRAGMPGFLLSPGTATEAEVRAERLHRLLQADPPKAGHAAVVAVKVRSNSLAVFIQIPVSEDPSIGELSEIARKVIEKTATAIPEATDPKKAVEIEVHAGKRRVATWKAGAWEFTPPPQPAD